LAYIVLSAFDALRSEIGLTVSVLRITYDQNQHQHHAVNLYKRDVRPSVTALTNAAQCNFVGMVKNYTGLIQRHPMLACVKFFL
jgi:hypothetical protein